MVMWRPTIGASAALVAVLCFLSLPSSITAIGGGGGSKVDCQVSGWTCGDCVNNSQDCTRYKTVTEKNGGSCSYPLSQSRTCATPAPTPAPIATTPAPTSAPIAASTPAPVTPTAAPTAAPTPPPAVPVTVSLAFPEATSAFFGARRHLLALDATFESEIKATLAGAAGLSASDVSITSFSAASRTVEAELDFSPLGTATVVAPTVVAFLTDVRINTETLFAGNTKATGAAVEAVAFPAGTAACPPAKSVSVIEAEIEAEKAAVIKTASFYPSAVAELEALAACPSGASDADVFNWLGFSVRKSPGATAADFARAEAYYHLSLKLNPAHQGALEYLGELYLMTGESAKALQTLYDLQKVCAGMPDLDTNCHELEELEEAFEAYNTPLTKQVQWIFPATVDTVTVAEGESVRLWWMYPGFSHNVVEVTEEQYNTCLDVDKGTELEVAGELKSYTLTPSKPVTYLVCTVAGAQGFHCELGQKLKVIVDGMQTPAPTAAPVASTAAPTAAPTATPTATPTTAPTATPVAASTATPVAASTATPTAAPTTVEPGSTSQGTALGPVMIGVIVAIIIQMIV